MRVAITYDNGNVFQHFGRTKYFKLFDIIDNKVTKSFIISNNSFGHTELVNVLINNNVDSLICGCIGNCAIDLLNKFSIKVYAGLEGNVDKAVEELLKGTLKYSENANCNHHDIENACDIEHCNCK